MMREYVIKVTDSVWPDEIHRFEEEYAPEQKLVRCKDCIYCKVAADKIWREDFCKSIYECDHLHLNYVEPDWFCADGKTE